MKTIGVNEHDLVGELYFQSPHSVTCEWILCGLLSKVIQELLEKQINQVCGVNLSIFLYFLQCVDGDKTCHLWTAVDLAFFVLMGVAGGLLGALFNCINKRLAKYRMRNVHPKARFIRYPREISIMDLY